MDKIYDQFELETIEKLAKLVSANELSEITIEDGDRKITVKGKKCPPPAMAMPFMAPAQQTAPAAAEISGNIVKSPIVGTFYAAPSPEKPPFVQVGDSVKKGDVIMIIESMKLMNEIKSEFDGKVKEILVLNGQAVEYDQPLMIIE
ncbi:MAG: acetyl-CoA carboxylase biotin carboxyl carrier protein [Ruminococcus sp.]|nr:acetyl-CoA carboxylase biotin carboxyl carrier protein [Clostridia bacterium]MBQ9078126.1 acetyl-CoA carboxylase biotin carboxyl carrier protein [Ruminococcus sp.]